MKLVIVESPSKAKTIEKYLGKDYQVVASGGHVRDLPSNNLGIIVSKNFEPIYIVSAGKEKTVEELKKHVKKAEIIYLATDPDREGEAISWHLMQILGLPDNTARIEFNEITNTAVNRAMQNPRVLDMNLVNAQQARRVLDRLVGYKISPILSDLVKKGLSAGRVQSVALKLLVDLEREIEAFKPEEYWNIHALVSQINQKTTYKTLFVDINGKRHKIKNGDEANRIEGKIRGAEVYVDSVKRSKSISKPAPPFTTSTMQQDAVSKLSFSASKVSQVAQKLYEGIEIPNYGHIALVTYIRTDSTRVSKEAQQNARTYIAKNYGPEYLPSSSPNYEKKGAQDAHEAIRPINLDIKPCDLKGKIDNDLYKLYKLIYDKFVASQMAPAVYDVLNVRIVAKNEEEYGFTLKGKTVVFPGYTAAYTDVVVETNEDKDEEAKNLPSFMEGEKLILNDVLKEQKFTKPPLRYTEATLIKVLEESGIGRPSTYATIMQVLSKREYTEKEGKFLKPTELGKIVTDELIQFFSTIVNVKFTSQMETELDKIADGEIDWKETINKFYPKLEKSIEKARSDGKKVRLEPKDTGIVCQVCKKGTLQVKEGKYGQFLGCSNYPECKNVLNYGEIVGVCPKCGSPIIKRFSKAKKLYFACASKNCDFYSWDLPAPYFCPVCHDKMKIVKTSSLTKYVCLNKSCEHVEIVEK